MSYFMLSIIYTQFSSLLKVKAPGLFGKKIAFLLEGYFFVGTEAEPAGYRSTEKN